MISDHLYTTPTFKSLSRGTHGGTLDWNSSSSTAQKVQRYLFHRAKRLLISVGLSTIKHIREHLCGLSVSLVCVCFLTMIGSFL